MFISTIHSFESLEMLKNSGIDAVIIGIPSFSIRHTIEVKLDDLFVWKKKCDELNLKLYVNCLKFVHEQELERLKETLTVLKEYVDGIYYSDEGVLFEARELGMESLLIYQPETLVTNANDVSFYLSQGIQSVSLAHELSLEEICSIASKNPNVEVLIHGYYSIMYSRRPLIKNYFNAIEKEIDLTKSYDLIEQTRKERMPIIQSEYGTTVFSEHPKGSYFQFHRLNSVGIRRFRIDSIFLDDAWCANVVESYINHTRLFGYDDSWYNKESILRKDD